MPTHSQPKCLHVHFTIELYLKTIEDCVNRTYRSYCLYSFILLNNMGKSQECLGILIADKIMSTFQL